MKVVVSLFDESGNMVRPWAEDGYNCHCFDIENTHRVEKVGLGTITFHESDLLDTDWHEYIVALKPVIIFGFPPCTDLAVSGARHFEAKYIVDNDFQTKAVELCRIVEKIGNACGVPWMLENPVSVLSTLWRKPNFIFNPNEYGGYLPANDIHPRWPDYIVARDAYPKKTCIWSGNGFDMPPKRPVPMDEGYSVQFHKLGGKSKKTKQIRSETPRGYAQAVKLNHAGWKV